MRYSNWKLVKLAAGISVIIFVLHIAKTRQPFLYGILNNRANKCPLAGDRIISSGPTATKRIRDPKVEKLIEIIQNETLLDVESLRTTNFIDLAKSLGRKKRITAPYTDNSLIHIVNRTETPNYLLFHYGLQKYSLYNPDDPAVDGLLHDLANLKITFTEILRVDSEFKLRIRFIDNGIALLKPMRNKRDQYHFEEIERHNAEIAGFHLSNGRLIDLTTEIIPLAEPDLNNTFYYSPVGNLCFWGSCEEYCDPRHSLCGNGSKIEASIMAFMPKKPFLVPANMENPYKNTYSRWDPPKFAKYADYCMNRVLGRKPFETMEKLLNLVDLHIFDFLQGNMDRHHLDYFKEIGLDGFLCAIDNGRAFGKTKKDEDDILAPLLQCCKIRKSTVQKFVNLYVGPRPLSQLFDQSMKSDPLYPILVDGHLTAVDRRATRVLRAVMECLEKGHTLEDIVVSIE